MFTVRVSMRRLGWSWLLRHAVHCQRQRQCSTIWSNCYLRSRIVTSQCPHCAGIDCLTFWLRSRIIHTLT